MMNECAVAHTWHNARRYKNELRAKRLDGCFFSDYGNWGSSAENITFQFGFIRLAWEGSRVSDCNAVNGTTIRMDLEVFAFYFGTGVFATLLDLRCLLGGRRLFFGRGFDFHGGSFGQFLFLFLDGSLFGREIHRHALTFEHGHGFHLAIVLEIIGETQEQYFTLFLEEDASSTEEDISLDFVAFAEEAFGVLELEVVIVIVGLRTEANLFDFHLHLLGFQLLLLLLLLVEEFRIIDQSTNGGLRIGADLDEIYSLLLCESKSIASLHNGAFGIVLHDTHFAYTDLFVYAILRLSRLFAVVSIGSQMCETIGFVNCLYAD